MPKRRNKQSTFSLSGWLFADLLLGLTMVFFLANSKGTLESSPTDTSLPTNTHTPSPGTPTNTLTPTQSHTPTPTSTNPSLTPTSTGTSLPSTPTNTPPPSITPGPIGLSISPFCYNIVNDLARDEIDQLLQTDSSIQNDLKSKIKDELTDITSDDHRIGMVIVWSNGIDLRQGVNISKQVWKFTKEIFPNAFVEVPSKSLYSDRTGNKGDVQFEIYLYSDSKIPDRSLLPECKM